MFSRHQSFRIITSYINILSSDTFDDGIESFHFIALLQFTLVSIPVSIKNWSWLMFILSPAVWDPPILCKRVIFLSFFFYISSDENNNEEQMTVLCLGGSSSILPRSLFSQQIDLGLISGIYLHRIPIKILLPHYFVSYLLRKKKFGLMIGWPERQEHERG